MREIDQNILFSLNDSFWIRRICCLSRWRSRHRIYHNRNACWSERFKSSWTWIYTIVVEQIPCPWSNTREASWGCSWTCKTRSNAGSTYIWNVWVARVTWWLANASLQNSSPNTRCACWGWSWTVTAEHRTITISTSFDRRFTWKSGSRTRIITSTWVKVKSCLASQTSVCCSIASFTFESRCWGTRCACWSWGIIVEAIQRSDCCTISYTCSIRSSV